MDAAKEIIGQNNAMWTLQKKNEVCQRQQKRWICLVSGLEKKVVYLN